MDSTDFSDSELVALSLAGERDAFGRIVNRYQTLLCSLTYSATGSVSQSEAGAGSLSVSASGSHFEECRPAGDRQAGGGDEGAIMAGLRGPGGFDRERILGGSAKIDAVELPLVCERLTRCG